MTTSLPQISTCLAKSNNSNQKIQYIENKRHFLKPIQQSIKQFIDNINNKDISKSQFRKHKYVQESSKIYSKRLKNLRMKLFNEDQKYIASYQKKENAKINNLQTNILNQTKIQIVKINQLNDFKLLLKSDKNKFKTKKKNQQNIINLKSYRQKAQPSSRLSLRQIKQAQKSQNKRYLKFQTQNSDIQQPIGKNIHYLKNFLKNNYSEINSTNKPKQFRSLKILQQEFSSNKNKNQIDYCKSNKDKYQKIKYLIMKKQRCRTSLQEKEELLLNIQEVKLKNSYRNLSIQQEKDIFLCNQKNKLHQINQRYKVSNQNYQQCKQINQKILEKDCPNKNLDSLNKYKSARYSEIPHYEFLYLDDPIQQNQQQGQNLDVLKDKNYLKNSKIRNHVLNQNNRKESQRKLSENQQKKTNDFKNQNISQINRLRSKTSNKILN